jgi:mannose-6-phosphate isomerase-like protein (cupin superfamily)
MSWRCTSPSDGGLFHQELRRDPVANERRHAPPPVQLEERAMTDTTVKKVSSEASPRGEKGQIHLASGKGVSMRLWRDEAPTDDKASSSHDYEVVGYVISGRAELEIEGQTVKLEPGDSWVVPKGATHHYRILEPFTAVEATSPPAELHGRGR